MNVPRLRFSEFVGEWEEKKLGEVAPLQRGFDLPVDNIIDGEYPVVFSNGILKYHNDFKVKAPGVVTGRSGTIGKVTYVDHDYWPHNTSLWVTDFKGNYPLFIYYFYNGYKLERFGTGSGVPTLNRNDIHSQKELFPKFQEQTKIASFLTAADDKLTQLKKKKSLLDEYKKGVMQKIFSQELRFKDDNGEDFPEWEEKRLGEVADITMGQSPDSNSYNTDSIGKPLIQGNADLIDRKSEPRNWTSEPTKECKIGDLILTVRAPVGTVAKSNHNACIGRGVCAIRNKSKSHIEFLYQFLLDYEPKWGRLEQGSTFTAVNGTDIKTIELSIPSLPEQTKIANFLSAIDEKINHCS